MIKILELDKRIGSSIWTTNHRFLDPITIAGIVSGAGALGSSIVSSIGQSKMSKAQLQQQKDLFYANWANQHQENLQSFRRSADFEREMFNAENMYNSPIELMRRLEAAGINPQVAINGSLGSASSQSASAGNAVSPAGAPGGIPQLPREFSPFEGIGQGLAAATGNIAGLLKTKAEIDELYSRSAKNSSETEGQNLENQKNAAVLDDLIDSLKAQYNLSTELDSLRASFAIQTVNNEQQLLKNQLEEVATRALKNASEGDLADAKKELTNVEKMFTEDKYNFYQKQKPLLLKELKESVNLLIEKQETENSSQALNYANRDVAISLKNLNEKEKESIIKDIKNKEIKNVSDAIDVFRKYKNLDSKFYDNFARLVLQRSSELSSGETLNDFLIKMLNE